MSRTQGGASFAEFSSREIASFWLLHAVNSGLSPLHHLWTSKRGHPEEAYLEMARLAGSLCTFAMDSTSARDPALRSRRPIGETFVALDQHIRRHLETIVPTNCISIPLIPGEKYFVSLGEIALDERCSQPVAVDPGRARRHGRGRYYRQDAPARQSLLFGVRSRAGSPRAPWNAPDPHAHAASGGIGQSGFSVLQYQQGGALLGPHRADQARGSLRPRRLAGS